MAVRVLAVAVAQPLGRGRQDGHAAAGGAQRLRHACATGAVDLGVRRVHGPLRFWLRSGQCSERRPAPAPVGAVALGRDGRFVIFAGESRMQYRRLGRSGLQVSELSLGSWVTYANQVDVAAARGVHGRRLRRRRELLRQRRGLRQRPEREPSWARRSSQLGWPRLNYVRVDQVLLGPGPRQDESPREPRRTRSTASTCTQAIDGSLQAPAARLRRPGRSATGPIRTRRSRRRCARCTTSSRRASCCTGAPASGAPTRSAPPGRSPTATTCTSR